MKKHLLSILAASLFAHAAWSQVVVELTLENRTVSGTDFLFDLYLRTTPASSGDLYLGNADFVITFNAGDFSSPVLSKEPAAAPGLCSLQPTDPSGGNAAATQDLYFNNTLVSLSGNELRVNLFGATPGSQSFFETRVAKINGDALTHRLGRFKIAGMTNPNSHASLTWKTTGSGLKTKGASLQPTGSFVASSFTISAVNPDNVCSQGAPTLVVTPATPALPLLRASGELQTSGAVAVPNGANQTYKAGNSISLNAEFEVALGAEFLATIEACNNVQEGEMNDEW